jgi:hypothetical protein
MTLLSGLPLESLVFERAIGEQVTEPGDRISERAMRFLVNFSLRCFENFPAGAFDRIAPNYPTREQSRALRYPPKPCPS